MGNFSFSNSNAGKAAMFTVVVMIAASILGFVLKAPGQVYMFAPILAVLILLVVTGDLFKREKLAELGLHKAGFNHWGFTILTPILVLLSAYLVMWTTPLASFAVPEGATAAMLLLIPVKLLITIALYTVTSSLGEEIGWRGYLLPKLARYGWKKALLLVGLIHGVFHFPIMLAGNYHSEGNPWIVVPMFLLSTVLIGIVLGLTRLRTGSVWPAAIMHAVHNVIWAALGEFTVMHAEQAVYVGGESGAVILLLYGAIAWRMWRKGPSPSK